MMNDEQTENFVNDFANRMKKAKNARSMGWLLYAEKTKVRMKNDKLVVAEVSGRKYLIKKGQLVNAKKLTEPLEIKLFINNELCI